MVRSRSFAPNLRKNRSSGDRAEQNVFGTGTFTELSRLMSKIKSRDIFSALPDAKKREVFQTLQKGNGFKIERIVSCGQATPEGKWLCSRASEWVAVLRGRAQLSFKWSRDKIDLKAGSFVFIRAGVRHRVDWTHPKRKTVWLAVHSVL